MGPGGITEVRGADIGVAPGTPTVGPVVLGIDFGGTKVALATCDLNGRRLRTEVVPTWPQEGASAALDRAIEAGRRITGEARRGRGLAAVGVSTIGIPLHTGVELAPAIPGWGELALGPRLESAFGVPVRVGTDVKLAASCEARWGALRGADPAIYLNLGTGLAAAIVTGGEVVAGAHGASGEIGYNITRLDQVGAPITHRRMLEHTVSGIGLAATGTARLGRPVTAHDLFTAADEPAAEAIVEEFLAELGMHLVNLVVAVDPQRVAVGGGIARSWPRLYPSLARALEAGVPFPPELVPAAHDDASLMGALSLGLQAAGAGTTDVQPGQAPSEPSDVPATSHPRSRSSS